MICDRQHVVFTVVAEGDFGWRVEARCQRHPSEKAGSNPLAMVYGNELERMFRRLQEKMFCPPRKDEDE